MLKKSGGECHSQDRGSRLYCALVRIVLPVGIFALLTGLLWVGDRSLYPRMYYWLLALPALILIILNPLLLRRFSCSSFGLAFIPFAAYMLLSILWSANEDSAVELFKRPFLVVLLYVAVIELGWQRFDLLCRVVKWSGFVAIIAGSYALLRFHYEGGQGRLVQGALFNPLLASHVFGFFIAFWFGLFVTHESNVKSLAFWGIVILGAVIFATGSRTPLLAATAVVIWLAVVYPNNKTVCGLIVLLLGGLLAWFFESEILLQRGLSYRTEIWTNILNQILAKLWFGHGFGTGMSIQLENIPYPFSDPHNITLSVFYSGGLVGVMLWVFLYAMTLFSAWKFREDRWVIVFSATVVFGLVAGMTEGGGFLSRPKEHWLLIWLPIALLAAAVQRAKMRL